MFTGIVQGTAKLINIEDKPGFQTFFFELPSHLLKDLQIGASVAVNGTCLTVTKIKGQNIFFDVIDETLQKTNLSLLKPNEMVNIERSARIGDEIGGHLLSGHITEKVPVLSINRHNNQHILSLQASEYARKYLLPKGYVALNGASLTLVDVMPQGIFTVHLIPETLRVTTFGNIKENDWVNLELDSQTQTIVDTLERLQLRKLG